MPGSRLLRSEREPHGWTARLSGARGNALGPEGLREIETFFTRAAGEGGAPVLLEAKGSSFCTGLDLELAWRLDREGMHRLMISFHRALTACFLYPGPVVAAVGGHALAGGALLALACDRRLMAIGRGRFGVHGIHLGISYPDVALEIVRHRLSPRAVEDLLYRGARMSDGEALRVGLVDRLVDEEELSSCARAERDALSGHQLSSFLAHKRSLRSSVGRRLAEPDPTSLERWLDRWFDPETRRRVGAARGRVSGGSGRSELREP